MSASDESVKGAHKAAQLTYQWQTKTSSGFVLTATLTDPQLQFPLYSAMMPKDIKIFEMQDVKSLSET